MTQGHHRVFLASVLGVVGANYLAQIPYYLDVYYFPHGALPALGGTLLLSATLVWFLAGYVLLARGGRAGYWLLLSFLLAEVTFYAHNMLIQVMHGYAPSFHLQARDAILVTVFGIGYLNLVCGLFFLFYLVRHSGALRAGRPARAPGAGDPE